MTYKEVKKGQWFTYIGWNRPMPLLKVSNVLFFHGGEFIRFDESIFVDSEGNPNDNIYLVDVNVEVAR